MKIKELMDKLKDYPQDNDVYFLNNEECYEFPYLVNGIYDTYIVSSSYGELDLQTIDQRIQDTTDYIKEVKKDIEKYGRYEYGVDKLAIPIDELNMLKKIKKNISRYKNNSIVLYNRREDV